jgi:SPP1 family predicted phage head-tail adaptor
MRAGLLDRRITIERATTTRDSYGQTIYTWHPLANVSAQVLAQSGKEFFAAAQLQASQRVLFRFRWIGALTALDRVSYGGRVFDIQFVRELGRRAGTELLTVAPA